VGFPRVSVSLRDEAVFNAAFKAAFNAAFKAAFKAVLDSTPYHGIGHNAPQRRSRAVDT